MRKNANHPGVLKNLTNAGKGRPKGSINKATKAVNDLRLLALESLDAVGGIVYLTKQAKDNPTAYLAFIGKCLPKDLNIQSHTPIQLITSIPNQEPPEPGE